jgi:SpoVK/Ycf46/Vps4 family AAA+-type ATPase
LEDLAGLVLRAGRRPYERGWGGVLLHGHTAADAALLVRAVAGEHDVPLLSVRAARLARAAVDSAVKAVFAYVREHAPCVLMIADLGALSSQAALTSRRVHSDLLTHLRGLAPSDRVVVVGITTHADDLAPSLRRPGGFDRPVALGVPTASERARIVRREVVLQGAVLDADPQAVVQVTDALAASQVRDAVATAVRSVRSRSAVSGAPPAVTARDLCQGVAAVHASPGIAALAFAPELVRRLKDVVTRLHDGRSTPTLALLGQRGNGRTTAVRWVAQQCDGGATWLTGADLAVLTSDDLKAVIDGVMAQRPTLVVIDDIDEAFAESATIDPKRLLAAIEEFVTSRAFALLLTAQERWAPSWASDLDDQIESHWIAHPTYRERVLLIRHVDPDADEGSVTALAAALHGVTRREIVAASVAARGER